MHALNYPTFQQYGNTQTSLLFQSQTKIKRTRKASYYFATANPKFYWNQYNFAGFPIWVSIRTLYSLKTISASSILSKMILKINDLLVCFTKWFQSPDYIIKCVQSLQKNRTFSVIIIKDSSVSMAMVLQGSCLSLTLYNIFTSDIPIPANWELLWNEIINNQEHELSSLDE